MTQRGAECATGGCADQQRVFVRQCVERIFDIIEVYRVKKFGR